MVNLEVWSLFCPRALIVDDPGSFLRDLTCQDWSSCQHGPAPGLVQPLLILVLFPGHPCKLVASCLMIPSPPLIPQSPHLFIHKVSTQSSSPYYCHAITNNFHQNVRQLFIVSGDMLYNGSLLLVITGIRNCVDSVRGVTTSLINNSVMIR